MTREQASKAVDPGRLRPYLPMDGYIISRAFETIRRKIVGPRAGDTPSVMVSLMAGVQTSTSVSFRIHQNDRYFGGGSVEYIPLWD